MEGGCGGNFQFDSVGVDGRTVKRIRKPEREKQNDSKNIRKINNVDNVFVVFLFLSVLEGRKTFGKLLKLREEEVTSMMNSFTSSLNKNKVMKQQNNPKQNLPPKTILN